MKARMWTIIAGMALALVIAIAVVPQVLAQGPTGGYGFNSQGALLAGTPGPGAGMGMRGSMGGRGGQMGGQAQSLVAVAAEKLGMTQADLIAQLQSGKTIAQVAADKQVDPKTIVDAFVATRQARMATAVAAGRMTQAQADAQLATAKANATARLSAPWSPQGRGVGTGAGFVDQNGDGVCDNAGSGRMGGGRGGR